MDNGLAIASGRRKFLMGSAAIAAAAAFGLPFEKVDAATILGKAAPDLKTYQPVFFPAEDFKTICAICDRLIPADAEGPGALESNVPVFIDQQLSGDYGKDWYLKGPFPKNPDPLMGYQMPYIPAETYTRGLAMFNTVVQKAKGKPFTELADADKDAVLASLEKGELNFNGLGEDYLTGKGFFSQVLSDTKNGYLADPMYGGNKGMGAWIMIGYPGARASFREWVTQHNVKYPLGPVSVLGDRA